MNVFGTSRPLVAALTLCTALYFGSPVSAPAAPANVRDASTEKLPVKVTADNMTYNSDTNIVVFTGNVETQRGDFRLWSELLTLYLKNDPKAAKSGKTTQSTAGATPAVEPAKPATANAPSETGSGTPNLDTGDIDHIVAEKNVRFRYNTQNGEAAKATYTAADGVLFMEGNPVIRDEENVVTGNTIRYFTNENRSEVEGGPKKRVEAVFTSNSQKKGQ